MQATAPDQRDEQYKGADADSRRDGEPDYEWNDADPRQAAIEHPDSDDANCAEHRRHREQKRIARRQLAVETEQERAGDSRTGATDPGDDREALDEADYQYLPKRHVSDPTRADRRKARRQKYRRGDQQHAGGELRLNEQRLERLLEEATDQCRRDGADDDQQQQPGVRTRCQSSADAPTADDVARRANPIPGHRNEGRPVEDHRGEQGRPVDDDVE